FELRIGDPALGHWMVGGDEHIEANAERLLIHGGGVLNVEVEATVVGIDLTAGDGELYQRAQQVQTGVHAHEPRAQVSVDFGAHALAGCGMRACLGGDVYNGGLVGVVDGGGDGTAAAAVDFEDAPVARLSAGCRVENGAIEHDAAALIDGEHARLTLAQVGVGAIELFSHDAASLARGRAPATRGRTGASVCVGRSNHASLVSSLLGFHIHLG